MRTSKRHCMGTDDCYNLKISLCRLQPCRFHILASCVLLYVSDVEPLLQLEVQRLWIHPPPQPFVNAYFIIGKS